MNNLVSVIMPVYNVSKYIVESIDSILNQSYKNIEIIIVDDFSTDNTYDLLIEKYNHFDNITILRNNENKKIVYSLNKALTYCKGEYIARVDGDDICDKYRIEKQLDYLISNSDIDLVGCSLEGINEQGEHLSYSDFPSDFNLLVKIARYSSPVSHIWLAKKKVYDDLKGYRFSSVEDYDFLLRMITAGYKFANIPNYYGMKIRQRTGNTVSLYGVKQRKAYNFVRNRYFERLKYGQERVSEDKFDTYINNKMFSKAHNLSNKFSSKAIHSKLKFKKIGYYLLSAITSPYQFQYLQHTVYRRLYIYFFNKRSGF